MISHLTARPDRAARRLYARSLRANASPGNDASSTISTFSINSRPCDDAHIAGCRCCRRAETQTWSGMQCILGSRWEAYQASVHSLGYCEDFLFFLCATSWVTFSGSPFHAMPLSRAVCIALTAGYAARGIVTPGCDLQHGIIVETCKPA